MNWESSIEIYTLRCVKQIVMGSCYITQGAQPGARRQPRGVGWSGRWEGGSRGGDVCTPVADLCWYMTETSTTLLGNYPPIRNNNFKGFFLFIWEMMIFIKFKSKMIMLLNSKKFSQLSFYSRSSVILCSLRFFFICLHFKWSRSVVSNSLRPQGL